MNKWFTLVVGLATSMSLFSQTNTEWATTTGNAFSMNLYETIKDNDGYVYTVGSFKGSMDLDPGPGSFNLNLGGSARDGFVQKLDSDGNFVWGAGFSAPGWTGSIQHASCRAITCDDSNNVYIMGNFIISADFDPGPGVHNVNSNGNDIFILKLNSDGEFVWVRTMGSNNGGNIGTDILFDPSGYIYTTGYFENSLDFNTDAGTEILSSDTRHAFVHKLDTAGNFIWVKTTSTPSVAPSSASEGISIALDTNSNIYMAGTFSGNQDFDPGQDSTILSSTSTFNDVFVMKLDSTGEFNWVKSIGGEATDEVTDLDISSSNTLYLTGFYRDSIDVDPGSGTYYLNSDTLESSFLVNLDTDGDFETALSLNGSLDTHIKSIHVNSNEEVYIAGRHRGTLDYDPGVNTLNSAYSEASRQNFFIKLDNSLNFEWAKSVPNTHLSGGEYIVPDETTGSVYVSGYYYDSLDFNNVIDTGIFVSEGSGDYFVMKFDDCAPSIGTHTVTACDSLIWLDSIAYTSNTNTMQYLLPNASADGCDSLVQLDLTVLSTSYSTDVIETCESIQWIDGVTYTEDNTTATHTLTSSMGCDSIVTLNLTINNTTSTLTETACFEYTSPSGQIFTNSGVIQDTISNAQSCDSIITINLTVNQFDLSVSQTGSTLESNETGASYQWLDCNNNNSPINGATGISFSPTQNGNYALEITKNGCMDTTACTLVENVSVYEFSEDDLQVYPNPTKENIHIVFSNEQEQVRVRLENILGQTVQENNYNSAQQITLDIKEQSGIYFLHIFTNTGQKQFIKIIKE